MFRKLLIANRGEIAVRIIRTCREMGIATLALYQASDRGSLHVRMADEATLLGTPAGFLDQSEILQIALEKQADAVHPGYGFLAERDDFIDRCQNVGVKFIGPSAMVVRGLQDKIGVIERVRAAGYSTVPHSECVYTADEMGAIQKEADRLGYPLVVKSCRGGRGRGERMVWSENRLYAAVRRSQAEAQSIYDDQRIFLEKAIWPAHQIGVQVIADAHGNLIHLGEREGSLLYGNQKIVEESPSPCLSPAQRDQILEAALEISRFYGVDNVVSVEFLIDQQGNPYFTEVKPRIQIEHPITEMISGIDLIREQIRLAWGEQLGISQDQVQLRGWAMQGRISAEDPWQQFMPSPGLLQKLRLPGGPNVRSDTYLYCGCEIPGSYDPLIAKIIVWGKDRPDCSVRLQRSLEEAQFSGVATNLSLIRRMVKRPEFIQGRYATDLASGEEGHEIVEEKYLRDLAVVAAIVYLRQHQSSRPRLPERLLSGWHRESRRLTS